MDYFSALHVFHSVCETGNFTATAKQLGVAVSSVTRQMDNLEQSLGIALFNRSTRKLSLTGAGIRYQKQTKPILDDLLQVNQQIKDDVLEPKGKLRLTFPSTYGISKLAPLLADFARQYPKIELELISSDDFVDLFSQPIDLAIRLGQVSDERLIAKKIAPQRRLLVASPAYLAQHGTPRQPQDLAAHNCLPFTFRGLAAKWYFKQGNRTQNIWAKGNLSGNNAEMLLQACLDGLGITHLPDWLVARHLQSGRLVEIFADWHIAPSDTAESDGIYLVYTPNNRQMMKINVLAEFLFARLQS
ncbi:LysR family transcriptional regulator [Neisseria chenwenguii]|uniref:LysR family transcriptional regulator n=1 Tax=Neisseria chenwenguii TaxID=1853278 RepID=A0A220S1U5_9NEIS|nr:LysR family transcriptional regulator [Neisseria chenwenguii]ASK27392.1 LysR family transcriptional regulator [Neisseria chenwenguii]ROV56936.1 LysR family transcriptional regulator [Neisseria chenwenguii]